jgi:hypothetical protein
MNKRKKKKRQCRASSYKKVANSELETQGCLDKVSRRDLLLKVYLQVETKEGRNECLSLHGALYLVLNFLAWF